MLTTEPRGTKDILPSEVGAWRYVEGVLRELCRCFGFKEIRTPVFEHTELFQRGIGDTTDVVEKEMYTFIDRGKRSITLRPENTASAVRAFVEHKMYAEPDPAKLFYIGPMFRYDRPLYRSHVPVRPASGWPPAPVPPVRGRAVGSFRP